MIGRKQCPECGCVKTERVHTDWYSDLVEETRVCSDCPAQFVNKYSLFEQEPQTKPIA